MNKEDLFSYGLVSAICLIIAALVLLFIVGPIFESFQRDGNAINDVEDFSMSLAFGMVGFSLCILLSLPK